MTRLAESSSSHRILLCAATFAEAQACMKGIIEARATDRFDVLQTGAGLERARTSLIRHLNSNPPPVGIVSTGFAGSLKRNNGVGTWVWGQDVSRRSERTIEISHPPSSILRAPLPWSSSRCLTVSSIITNERDAEVGRTSADAVDMESYAWAEIAHKNQIPLYIIRLISDTPEDPLPEAIKIWVQGKKWKSARHMVRDPFSMARFFAKSNDLLKDLTRGWATLARDWSIE